MATGHIPVSLRYYRLIFIIKTNVQWNSKSSAILSVKLYVLSVKQEPPIGNTWWKHLAAGGVSGVVSRTLTAPLDRLKVLAQVSGNAVNVFKGLANLIKTDGPFALWRGNGINLLKIVPESAAKFTCYEVTKVFMIGKERQPLSNRDRFIAASISGVTSQTIIYPIEVLKTRLVIQHGLLGLSLQNACKNIISKLGYLGFYRGYASAMAGIILFSGTDLTIYENTKVHLMKKFKTREQIPSHLLALSAVVACLFGQALSFPLAMSSTTVQIKDDWKTSAMSVMKERYRHHGIYGLFKGSSMAYMKSIPAVIISYFIYENVLWNLGASMTY